MAARWPVPGTGTTQMSAGETMNTIIIRHPLAGTGFAVVTLGL